MSEIWFWQRMVTPHMVELAKDMARLGHEVVYVAEELLSKDRVAQGWLLPETDGIQVKLAPSAKEASDLANCAPVDAVHICQGIRGNGVVSSGQRALKKRHARQLVVMETVDTTVPFGFLKAAVYSICFASYRAHLLGVLAIGHSTTQWLSKRGVSSEKLFPFAYFLADQDPNLVLPISSNDVFRFVFVGSLLRLKRVELLIRALHLVDLDFELIIIGGGPLEEPLKELAKKLLPNKTKWMGRVPSNLVSYHLSRSDCLVLPSRHDGWGAVVSEALMVGTPVVCSDSCGAAGTVKASGFGGVFESGNLAALVAELRKALVARPVAMQDRVSLMNWAKCLGAKAGALYLDSILKAITSKCSRPLPPWLPNHVP